MLLHDRGGGRTGQLVGLLMDTTTMTIVMSANRVYLGSFRSRCCTFRRTKTIADPIRLLYIRLALPLKIPSGFAPNEGRTVGVVGTRANWVLKEDGGVITTSPLLQYVA